MNRLISIMLALLLLCLPAAVEEQVSVRVASPNGAPGVALAVLAAEAPDQYTYVAAEAITAEFASENADLIIAPLNAGARLFLSGKSTYRLAAVLTWGNLYFASQRENFTLEDINGAEVTLFGENTVNAAVALYALSQNGIVPGSVQYLAGAANTQSLLLTDDQAIVLTAEPALTAASIKNERITGYALNDLYRSATGYDGFPQAGLFIRAESAERYPEVMNNYLLQAKAAADQCATDLEGVAQAAVTLGLLPNLKVAQAAIPHCAIRYMSAQEAREQIEFVAGIDLTQFGGQLPSDEFYYQ